MERGNITTADSIAGKRIVSQLGIVRGLAVENLHFADGIFGPDSKSYCERLEFAFATAEFSMVQNAEKLEANGVIAVKFSVTQNPLHSIAVLAYGTAVVIEDCSAG